MPIDFTLTPELLRLRGDARAFARDVLSKVGSATRDLPTPLARFTATRPFYEQTVGAGFLRRLIPAPLGGQGTGILDMAVLAEEFHAVDVNISLTLFGTMLGLFPVLLGGTPEQAARFFAPFVAGHGAPLADAKMAIEAVRSLSLRAAHAFDTRAPSALELALHAKVFGSETAVRVISDLMRVVGIDSYDRTLPLGGLLADALVLPLFDGGNMGVRRRQLHELMQMPDYDPLAASGN